MDPATVIVLLATHLACSGGLLLLVGRAMPARSGIRLWGAGLGMFGLAYGARLLVGLQTQLVWAPVLDAAMVAAVLLVVAGLRQYVGRDALPRRTAAFVLLGCIGLEALAILAAGALGRYTLINLELGLLYAWQCLDAARAQGRVEAPLRLPLRVLAFLAGSLSLMALARAAHIATHGVAVVYGGGFTQLFYAYASLVAVLFAMCLLWMVFARLNHQLADLATRDALTRVLNRTGLDEALARHFGSRQTPPLTMLAIDLDEFKRINDSHGHATGDLVLRAVADTLTRHVRPSDLVARTGGEEFVVCSATGDAGAALALAERLREAAAALATVATDGRTRVRCTLSVGVSAPFAALIDRPRAEAEADRALYAAKRAGRDRVLTSQAIGESLPA
jgi:diguanylate cyclase (GGDEF)-like protein